MKFGGWKYRHSKLRENGFLCGRELKSSLRMRFLSNTFTHTHTQKHVVINSFQLSPSKQRLPFLP